MSGHSAWLQKRKELYSRDLKRLYDEVFEDVGREFKRSDTEQQNELRKRDDQQQILSGRYNEEIIRNSYLMEENSRLKHHLEELAPDKSMQFLESSRARDTASANTGKSDTRCATISSDEYFRLTERFKELDQKHRDTLQKLKYAERKIAAAMQKNQDMKESVRAWQKYSERHQAKVDQAGSANKENGMRDTPELSRSNDVPTIPSSPPTTLIALQGFEGLDRPSPALLSHFAQSKDDSGLKISSYPISAAHRSGMHRIGDALQLETPISDSSKEHPARNGSIVQHISHGNEGELPAISRTSETWQACSDKISSSQTTEAPEDTSAAVHPVSVVESDDYPRFVSEKSLKRRRVDQSPLFRASIYIDQNSGTHAESYRIKEEPTSSPPTKQPDGEPLHKDTLDLDELGSHLLATPHRRRLARNAPFHSAPLRHQRSTSAPLIKEEAEVLDDSRAAHFNTNFQRMPSNLMRITGDIRAHSEPSQPTKHEPSPLQPLDPNTRSVRHTDVPPPNKRPKRKELRQSEKYQMLTEAGDRLPSDPKKGQLPPSATRTRFNRRIRGVQDHATPSKASPSGTYPPSTIRLATSPISIKLTEEQGFAKAIPPKDAPTKLLVNSNTIIADAGCSKWPTPRKVDTARSSPRQSLRSKPPDQLRLTDFKTNPKYQQGYSYAFSETVRKRSDRACLPGCTSEECCGSTFRALAAAAPPLIPSEEEKLLEDFLGDTYESMQLSQILPSERAELVLQARTRELANKHGRHRQAFERHRTPPGFWRVDFPTTQEEQEDRAQATTMEKDMVRLRYAEAMRKGGKWVFRDE